MIMRLKPRGGGPEKTAVIASFRQERRGIRAFDVNGNDVGYFGPEEYEKIILGLKAPERDPAGGFDQT
jgi:hypothetical protein